MLGLVKGCRRDSGLNERIHMGQYYMVVNTAKKECLDPHKFGDGAKLMEFGLSKMGMMSNCKNCLVFLRTGTEDCGGTPYYEVKDAVYDADQSDVIEACEAEVEFLESLLPEKKPVKKALK